jgi:ribosome-associated heat shock protein Hsp15
MKPAHTEPASIKVRLDKWLWAARFYKTRGLSSEEIDKGRVRLNGQLAKPSKDVKVGDTLEMRIGHEVRTVVVKGLSGVRAAAPVAALLFEETAASLAQRAANAEMRRLAPEPAHSQTMGRPTKRDRRDIDGLREDAPKDGWNDRWSASLDDLD